MIDTNWPRALCRRLGVRPAAALEDTLADESEPKEPAIDGMVTAITASANVVHPAVPVRAVIDPSVLDQGRVYAEALSQTQAIAAPGAHAVRIAEMVRDGTARPNALTQTAAERMATSGRSLDSFINGANPGGKAAEVVAISDYRNLHAGQETGSASECRE